MKGNNSHTSQRILVLIDFSTSSYMALKYAISLAKTIDASLILLYVAKPRDVVDSENPVVATRAMEIAASEKENQFKSIIEIIEAEDVSVEYVNTIGNARLQIDLYSEKYSPNLIVIGKSNYGNNSLGEIANYLVFQDTRNVLIVGKDSEFNRDTQISVECNSETLNDYSSNILFWLNQKTKAPLRVFVNRRKRSIEEFQFPENWRGIAESSHKLCIKNNQSFSLAKSIINHISTEKIDLVCIGRKGINKSFFTKLFNRPNTTSEVINNAKIPTLIMGGHANF